MYFFGWARRPTSNKLFDFAADPDRDPGIFTTQEYRQFKEFCGIISLGGGLHSQSALAKLSVSYYIVTNYYIIGCNKSYARIRSLQFNHQLNSNSVCCTAPL